MVKRSPFDRAGVLKYLPKLKLMVDPKTYRMPHAYYKLEDIEKL